MGPLHGVKAIELAGIGPVPFCGMVLGDLGADVVLVERALPAGSAGEIADAGILRRNRRSIVLDLKRSEAVEILLRLVSDADILYEGMRPGVAERLGVGPDACLAINPALVYGRMTGWGQDGPMAQRAGHDINYISVGGALHAIGREVPTPPLNLVGDFGGGAMLLLVGLLSALTEARSSGVGQVVDVAMYEGANLLMTMFWEQFGQGRWLDERAANVLDGGAPFSDAYRCSDGRWVAVGAIEPQFRAELLRGLGVPFTEADLGLDRALWDRQRAQLAEAFAASPRDHWVALFADVDACVTPVLGLGEAPDHPHAVARGAFLTAEHGVQPAPAPRFSRSPADIPTAPPERGAHTAEILDEAGFGEAEIAMLRDSGAIA
jgi:alpha-methylacyl-CoA racemase